MQLSVVILNYNVGHFLELCLKSVVAAIAGLEAEIIVVDNNSSDGSCAMVKRLFPEVILIENPENTGFSKGNNLGVSRAKGEYLCILNPDTMVPEDAFSQLLAFAGRQRHLGILGCRLIDGRGRFLPESKRNLPTPWVALQKMMGRSKAYYCHRLEPHALGEVDVLVGAFMLLKRDLYLQLGGFDEAYFMYGEDVDLSYSALRAGYKNYYFGAVSVLHFKGESTLKDKVYAQHFYGAMRIFYNKYFKNFKLFDLVVWMGIFTVRSVRPGEKKAKIEPRQYRLLSKKPNFKPSLPFPVPVLGAGERVEPGTQVIMDGANYSYKEMLSFMEAHAQMKEVTFRIWPMGSDFVIGSDTSTGRGEVCIIPDQVKAE